MTQHSEEPLSPASQSAEPANESHRAKIAHDNLRIVEDADRGRFDLWQGDTFIGFAGYELKDHVLVFQHTLIDEQYGRRGYARALVTLVLESARSRGWKVQPVCTYVVDYLRRYPEYQDLVVSTADDGGQK